MLTNTCFITSKTQLSFRASLVYQSINVFLLTLSKSFELRTECFVHLNCSMCSCFLETAMAKKKKLLCPENDLFKCV